MTTDESRILSLLETVMETGLTPEEVCADCPELLADLRDHVEQCRRVDAQIESLFGSPELIGDIDDSGQDHAHTALPIVPGYRLIDVLGRGGMGIVYRARQIRLNRTVALKMLLAGSYASRQERARFLREARAVAGLTHVNIVRVHDVGEFDGRLYFTMELVEGPTLAESLAGNPKSGAESAAMTATLADGIASAHRGGIVHRDLKPSNVLLAADGTPKISDFGLARRFDVDDDLTLVGTRLGTPSYMAPEQMGGRETEIGPATDVYSLGAILYEMLTGRPPFRGESPSETERQLLAEDPVPPSRLNARVPRDLETICLKCLRKDPRRRYESAAELAADVRRFQRGEPIEARPISRARRLAKWVRRRPAAAVTICFFALVVLGSTAGTVWIASRRSAVNRLVEQDLREVMAAQQRSDWDDASTDLDRARIRLGDGGSVVLRHRLDLASHDTDLAKRLEAIRLSHGGSLKSTPSRSRACRDYAKVLNDAGLVDQKLDPITIADRIKRSPVHTAVFDAISDWLPCTTDSASKDWLRKVQANADDDPTGWRKSVIDAARRHDTAALARLSADAELSTSSMQILSNQMLDQGLNILPFLIGVQRAHPGDFWVDMMLGGIMFIKQDYPESMRYYQAAVAVRPNVAYVHVELGSCLYNLGRANDAIDEYTEASRIDQSPATDLYLGIALADARREKEAIKQLEHVIAIDPTEPMAYAVVGELLLNQDKTDEALARYKQALAIDPTLVTAQEGIRHVYARRGDWIKVTQAWRAAVDSGSTDPEAYNGYAEFRLMLDDQPEADRMRQLMLKMFGDTDDPTIIEQVARTGLLTQPTPDDLQRINDLIDKGILLESKQRTQIRPYLMLTKGLAEYRAGRFQSAVTILTGEAGTVGAHIPKLILAMARFRLGQTDAARKLLASAIVGVDWDKSRALTPGVPFCQVLRHEAEILILGHDDQTN